MRKLVVVLAIIGAIVLGVSLWQVDKEKDKEAVEYSEMEQKLIPLSVEKRKLEQQLTAIDREDEEAKRERGTVVVLFVELREEVYTEIFPIMEEFGYKGVLALSTDQFPGEEGCMSVKQFKKLIKAGWSYCTVWDKTRSIDVWHIFMKDKMEKLEIENKSTMYFPLSTYKKSHNESLKEYGYEIIAHHGERNLSLYPKTTKKGAMWYPGVCGMAGEAPKTKLREVARSGSNIVYTIGFTLEEEMYEEATFRRMLQEFQTHEKAGEILVMDFEEAREYHLEMQAKKTGTDMTVEEQKEAVRQQIQEVEKQIDELYAQYAK